MNYHGHEITVPPEKKKVTDDMTQDKNCDKMYRLKVQLERRKEKVDFKI